MREKIKNLMKGFIAGVGCILILGAVMNVKAETIYSEGYFHYVIEEKAVKITEYFGTQNEVTVPSMIAGYPVETIGTGVFANNQIVQKVNLPDTITRVEEKAFGSGQTVVYDSNTEEPQSTQPEKNESSSESSEEGISEGNTDEQEVSIPSQKNLVDHLGRVISVDNQKRLIATASDGTVSILDDSKEYKETTEEDGTTHITDAEGKNVTVNENGAVKTTDKGTGNKKWIMMITSVGLIILLAGVVYYMRRRKRNER